MKQISILGIPLICLGLLLAPTVEAKKQSAYPRGCSPDDVNYRGDYLFLGTEQNDRVHRVYVLYNVSYAPVLVQHPTNGHILSLPQPSIIKPGKWSAILVENHNYPIACQDYTIGYQHQIACSEVVKACELAVSPVMLSSQGEYWITENNSSKSALFSTIRSEGIYP